MNAQCTRDAEVHLFMVALDKVQRVMAKLSSDHKFSGRYNTVTISGVVRKHVIAFDVLLTVHLSITLANDQLDAQILIHLLQSSTCTCFERYLSHPQEVKLY